METDYEVLNQMRRERHARWHEENSAVINQSKIPYTESNHGQGFLFREKGKLKIDFYPGTGRWKYNVSSKTIVMKGGAKKFLMWYLIHGEIRRGEPRTQTHMK